MIDPYGHARTGPLRTVQCTTNLVGFTPKTSASMPHGHTWNQKLVGCSCLLVPSSTAMAASAAAFWHQPRFLQRITTASAAVAVPHAAAPAPLPLPSRFHQELGAQGRGAPPAAAPNPPAPAPPPASSEVMMVIKQIPIHRRQDYTFSYNCAGATACLLCYLPTDHMCQTPKTPAALPSGRVCCLIGASYAPGLPPHDTQISAANAVEPLSSLLTHSSPCRLTKVLLVHISYLELRGRPGRRQRGGPAAAAGPSCASAARGCGGRCGSARAPPWSGWPPRCSSTPCGRSWAARSLQRGRASS